MSAFVTAQLVGSEADAEDGDRVISRFLQLSAKDAAFAVFDTHPDWRDLQVGQTYVWLLFVFAHELAPYEDGPTQEQHAASLNGATLARILDTHWWLPPSWTAVGSPTAQQRSVVLLETPLGWVITSRTSLAESYRDHARAGDLIMWDHARLDLVGVAGVPLTSVGHVRRSSDRPVSEEANSPAPVPHAPSPDIQERLDQHVLWLDSDGQQGLQFGLRPGSPPLNMRNQDLRGLQLAGVRLNEASLAQARLGGADLRGTNLAHAYFAKGSLVGATLDGATLTGARGPRAIFERASLRQIIADRADFSDTNMRQTNLTNAHLRGADFQDADLTDATLNGADLTNANLENAQLAGARLTGARLMGAFLEGATGVESVIVEFVFVGAPDAPRRLEGDELQQWLREAVAKKTRVTDEATTD